MRCPGAAEVGAILCRPTRRREAGESCAGGTQSRKKAFLDWSGQGIDLQARSESNAFRIRTWYFIPKDPPGFSSALSPVWKSVRRRAFLVQRQRYKSPQHTVNDLGGRHSNPAEWLYQRRIPLKENTAYFNSPIYWEPWFCPQLDQVPPLS